MKIDKKEWKELIKDQIALTKWHRERYGEVEYIGADKNRVFIFHLKGEIPIVAENEKKAKEWLKGYLGTTGRERIQFKHFKLDYYKLKGELKLNDDVTKERETS